MMTDAVTAVFALLQAGTHVDSTLAPRLANSSTEVSNVQAHLQSAASAFPAESTTLLGYKTMLDDFDPTNMPALSTYIAANLPTLVERMAVFSSISNLDDTASISAAFGAEFAARSFVAAIDSCGDILDNLGDPNLIPSSLPILTIGDAMDALADRVSQILAIPSTVPASITAQDNFNSASALTLNNYSDALHLVQMFSDISFKGVIGAAGSDALLAILNPIPTSVTPPPPIDGSNSGLGDPIPPIV
jgi:hypothetical protein